MTARPQLPGVRWFLWLRNDALRTGVLTGIYLSCIFFAWLWIANRMPRLESFAAIRNLTSGAVVVMLMSIPVLRFRNQPMKLFVSGGVAWTLLTLIYRAMEMRFSLLESRMGAFHVFMLGAICYGFIAVFQWVFLLCAKARQDYMAHARQDAVSATRRPIE
jgi:predicted membrane channel-forming protein YqfA (hemolysin III family)